ncbi:hypothetical protein [uncultured Microbulbifer sp.]|uniref:hypothetical protein n=1 Tax=uncultured Microbulbifer sp. TaxID=348147 RepID=UPI0025D918B6|nr:hypothetical protein [uncultured Microbulbifer sp.]
MRKIIFASLVFLFSESVVSEEAPAPHEYEINTVDDQAFKIYVFEPGGGNRSGSAVITVHGGGWKWGKAAWTFRSAKMFADSGMLSVAVENSPVATGNGSMPPVSIVQGELDTLTPLTGAKKFCEKIEAERGGCELHVYPGVGHLLTRNLENQESDFDPDPRFVKEGDAKLVRFLEKSGYISSRSGEAI